MKNIIKIRKKQNKNGVYEKEQRLQTYVVLSVEFVFSVDDEVFS